MKLRLLTILSLQFCALRALPQQSQVDNEVFTFLTDSKFFSSADLSSAVTSENLKRRTNALTIWFTYLKFRETFDSAGIPPPKPTEWYLSVPRFANWAKDLPTLVAFGAPMKPESELSAILAEVKAAASWDELTAAEWKKALQTYSIDKSPDWLQVSPSSLREMKNSVEGAVAELAASSVGGAQTFENSWPRGMDALFLLPASAEQPEITKIVQLWNDALGILGARTIGTAPMPPPAPAPPSPVPALSSDALANARNKLTTEIRTSLVEMLSVPILIESGPGSPDGLKAAVVTKVLDSPGKALTDSLTTLIELAKMREQWPKVVSEIQGQVGDAIKKLYASYGRIALSPPDLNLDAETKILDAEWKNLAAALVHSSRLRRVVATWNAIFESNLTELRSKLLDNSVKLREAMTILAGLRLENALSGWDVRCGYRKLSLQVPSVATADGKDLLTKVDGKDQPLDPITVQGEIRSLLIAAWSDSKLVNIENAAFGSHKLVTNDKFGRGDAELNQKNLLDWAQSSGAAAPWGPASLFGFRLYVQSPIALSQQQIPRLTLVTSELELRSGGHLDIPEGCELTIVTHYLKSGSLTSGTEGVPVSIALGGPNSKLSIFSSSSIAAPNFVRVAGKGKFLFRSIPDAFSPTNAWSQLAGANGNILNKLTDFWLLTNRAFLKNHRETSPDFDLQVTALFDLMSLPPFTFAKQAEVDAMNAEVAGWRKELLGRQVHFVSDPITLRNYPVYYSTSAGAPKLYLLPDEIVVVPTDRYLGSIVHSDNKMSLEFTVRARLSDHAKTRGRQLAREYFGGGPMAELPPATMRLAFNSSVHGFFTVKKLATPPTSVETSQKIESAPISYQDVIHIGQDMLSGSPSMRPLTLTLEEEKDGEFIPRPEISYLLPVMVSNLDAKPVLVSHDLINRRIQLSNQNPNGFYSLRPLFLTAKESPPFLFENRVSLTSGGVVSLDFGPANALILPSVHAEYLFPPSATLFELLKVNQEPKFNDYVIDIKGLIEARFPTANGTQGEGAGVDLERSRIRIEYAPSSSPTETKWIRSDSTVAAFRATHGMVSELRGYYGHQFDIVLDCHSAEAVANPAKRTLRFKLDIKFAPTRGEVEKMLATVPQ